MADWIYFIHPPRDDFAATMTPEEDAVWGVHFRRFQRLLADGVIVLVGPTLGPINTGIAIFQAEDEAAARRIIDEDPVIAGGSPGASCDPSVSRCSAGATAGPRGRRGRRTDPGRAKPRGDPMAAFAILGQARLRSRSRKGSSTTSRLDAAALALDRPFDLDAGADPLELRRHARQRDRLLEDRAPAVTGRLADLAAARAEHRDVAAVDRRARSRAAAPARRTGPRCRPSRARGRRAGDRVRRAAVPRAAPAARRTPPCRSSTRRPSPISYGE